MTRTGVTIYIKKRYLLPLIFSWLCFLSSCHEKKTHPLFQLIKNSGINFMNKVQDNDSINILNYRNFYNGGGVGAGDINNDGLADIFFTANQGSNKLFLNKGNWQFVDISERAGFKDKLQFSTGVVMADVNGDGWLDIFVCNAGNMHNAALRSNQLYINNHDLTFTESAAKYGLADSGYTTHASFFDYDLDGDLDCFIIDNSPVPVNSLGYPDQRDLPASQWKVEDYLKGGGDHLYRNDNGHFTEVSKQAGIHGTLMSFGLGVTVGDVNGDNYPDVFVSNDFFERDYLYINQKNGTFKDELEQRMQHNSYASMGADLGDINNDGYPEIFTTDMLPADDYRLKTTLSFDDIDHYRLRERNGFFNQFLQNTLQLNDGTGHFKDIANYSGVNASEWSWGALMFDADNDGLNDLYVCNGIYRDLTNQDFLVFDANEVKEKMLRTGRKDMDDLIGRIPSIAVPNKMFHNLGNFKFSDEGANWGFAENSFSNGAAYADFDNDGDLDLVINNVNEPAFLFRNNSREQTKNNFIGISLKGTVNNTFAVGARIAVYAGNQILTREIMPGRGFQSSVDYRQSIGIGQAKSVDSMKITWPDRTGLTVIGPEINKYLFFTEKNTGKPIDQQELYNPKTMFTEKPTGFSKHFDDDFTDFYTERGIQQMLSHEGPPAAAADVNGDGIEDIYIGGTVSKPGQLYVQDATGNFTEKDVPAFKQYNGFVDGAALFFDCDKDGDNDLLICSGGNAALPGSRELQHRLYINDGHGNFQISTRAFPANKDNISVAVANDFDNDGDLDLFIGARSVTGMYGITPLSHIYVNDGSGNFSGLSADKCKDITDAGMVTGAVWTDIDNDKVKELVIVGEWMSPRVFKYNNGRFSELKTNLNDMIGWWQTVAAADINGDGKTDLILGNIGENFYLKPTREKPVKLFINDFDGNGQIDKILTQTINNQDKPVFMKGEVESQVPVIKKQNLHYSQYATKSIEDIFGKEKTDQSLVKQVNYSSSVAAVNVGNGIFRIQTLPMDIQFSSLKALLPVDLNNDGFIDFATGGNEFGFQPQLGRLDANEGELLMNNGKGEFTIADKKISGIELHGQVRNIVMIKGKGEINLLYLQNNRYPVLFERGKKPGKK